MSDEKFVLVSLEDPKMKSLSGVLGNKTCKRIVDYLAENAEASEKDLADALDMPINTVEYNIKKLVDSSLVHKKKNFFWSKKGKKIAMYEISNKSIVISPKKLTGEKLKALLPAFMVTVVGSFVAYVYEKISTINNQPSIVSRDMAFGGITKVVNPSAANSLSSTGSSDVIVQATTNYGSDLLYSSPGTLWVMFLAGGLVALFVYSIVNWKKL